MGVKYCAAETTVNGEHRST